MEANLDQEYRHNIDLEVHHLSAVSRIDNSNQNHTVAMFSKIPTELLRNSFQLTGGSRRKITYVHNSKLIAYVPLRSFRLRLFALP